MLFTLFKNIRGFLWFNPSFRYTIVFYHVFLRFTERNGKLRERNYRCFLSFFRDRFVSPSFFYHSSTLKNITRCTFLSRETPNVSFRRNIRDPWRMVSTLSYRVVVFFTRLFLHRRVTWFHLARIIRMYDITWPIHLVHLIIGININS